MNLLEIAEELVPKGVRGQIRDDVVQEVAIALYEGSLLEGDSAALKRIINREYSKSELAFGHPVSLDEPDRFTGRSLYEIRELRSIPKFIAYKRVYSRKFRKEHREEYLAYLRDYYQRRREELRVRHRENYWEHEEERKTYQRQYYQEHKGERTAYSRQYRLEHREEVQVSKFRYQQEHRKECRVRSLRYYWEHKEERNAYARKYALEHREEINARRRRRRSEVSS